MLTYLPPRRRARPVVLSERGQGLAVLLFFLAGLLGLCARAKGLL